MCHLGIIVWNTQVRSVDYGVRIGEDSDSDDDGVIDGEELANGTDPIDRDSDDDGFSRIQTIDRQNKWWYYQVVPRYPEISGFQDFDCLEGDMF